MPLEEDDFLNGQWLSIVPKLLQFPRITRNVINGADQAASFIYKILTKR
jgi:hypothetical protein